MGIKYPSNNSGHKDSYNIGIEFEDFVCIHLAKSGVILQNIHSKKFQYETGENLQGFEIKYDARSLGCNNTEATKQLSIEIAEKSKKDIPFYTPSGIYRGDNAWLYIIGNYKAIWVFSVSILRLLHESGRYTEHTLPTIKKYHLPLKDAQKYCAKSIEFEDGIIDTTIAYKKERDTNTFNLNTNGNGNGKGDESQQLIYVDVGKGHHMYLPADEYNQLMKEINS